ncbi:sigma-70 family RNA polymerase sigma factor [bacterium]|nr:sigma-70 family RNA polymerase sigma factor [bacterium]
MRSTSPDCCSDRDGIGTTSPSLLLRVRDPGDNAAWQQFIEIYGPLLNRFLRGKGLQEADAADVTQEILRSVLLAIGRFEYDRRAGRFRGWLLTVAYSKLNTFLTRRQRQTLGSGDTDMELALRNVPEPAAESVDWEREYQQRLYEWACQQARNEFQTSTWRAFWMRNVDGRSSDDVAQELQMSVGAVYIACSRVTARLRALIQQVDDE